MPRLCWATRVAHCGSTWHEAAQAGKSAFWSVAVGPAAAPRRLEGPQSCFRGAGCLNGRARMARPPSAPLGRGAPPAALHSDTHPRTRSIGGRGARQSDHGCSSAATPYKIPPPSSPPFRPRCYCAIRCTHYHDRPYPTAISLPTHATRTARPSPPPTHEGGRRTLLASLGPPAPAASPRWPHAPAVFYT